MPARLLWGHYIYCAAQFFCGYKAPSKRIASGLLIKGASRCRQYIIGWLLCLAGVICPLVSSAQAPPSNVPTVIPPAPTAAALEKYGLVPVSTYTGVPNISLPLYEIKVRDITLPLSLSYHAGGFRVTEEASWVGLGWSLQAGGVLTHTTRNQDDLTWFVPRAGVSTYGMPDCTPANDLTSGGVFGIPSFLGDPYTGATTIMASGGSGLSPQVVTYVQGTGLPYAMNGVYQNQQVDWEPDEYRFTMGNYSGAFVFDQQGTIHLLEAQQQVHISYAYAADGHVVWTVRTPDGFRYEFAAPEFTSTIGTSTTSAWYLTRIVSPLGEEVTLTYEQGANIYNQPAFTQTEIKQQQYSAQPGAPQASGYSAGATVPQYLRRIDFKTGYVLFERDAALRKDLQGGQRLKRIAIYSRADALLKAFDLQASYFESPSSAGYLATYAGWSNNLDSAKVYEGRRLRLDAVFEGGQNGETKPPTRLSYNATPLPVKSSYSVDYWGYYNGRSSTSLIPTYAGPDLSGVYVVYPGADRTSVAGPMQADILQTITYPTGGTTTFTFEPHAYGNLTEEEDQLVEGTMSFRMQADNVSASPYDPASQLIRINAPTPLTLDYTLSVENGGNLDDKKARTTIQLIDSTTNKPFTSGAVDLGNYVQAQWGFFSSTSTPTPSSPYNPANMVQVSGHVVVLLPAGSYKLIGYTPTCNSSDVGGCHATVFAQGSYPIQQHLQSSSVHQLLAGGLRVKRIEQAGQLDATRNRIQVFAYGADSTNAAGQAITTSNGILLNRPVFSKVVKYFYAEEEKFRHELTSFSQTALSAGAKGSAVGYAQVSVLEGAQGEGGKTVYSYYCQPDASVRYQDRQPNVPSRADELNGSLLSQATYRHDATGFHLVSNTTNTYESVLDTRYHYDVPAVYQGEIFTVSANGTGDSKGRRLYFYPIPVNWVRLVNTTSRQYDTQNKDKFWTTSTRYTYDTLQTGHMQVSQVRTRRSDGSTQLTLSTYPADYTTLTSGPLVAMRSPETYQPTAVVETQTLVYGVGETAAAAKAIAGSYTTYTKPTSTSGYLPAVMGHLSLAQPQAALRPAAPTLPALSSYSQQQLIHYSPSANVEQVNRVHELPTVFLWGYGNALPVAQVKNATLAQVQAALGVDVNTLTTDQQLRSVFQQVRQRLPQAQITSFTHQPLVGITSQTGPDGRTVFFEYDGLQRLLRTRDEQGRILSQQQYHYAGK